MSTKRIQSKNDYKSIAHQINNGKNKTNKNANQYIKNENMVNGNNAKSNEDKFDKSAFVMVPINHPKINEIIKLLNEVENHKESFNYKENTNNDTRSNLDNKKSENNFKLIITLNDIITNINNNKMTIPENSIITPLAKDYIKQKKIEVIYTKN